MKTSCSASFATCCRCWSKRACARRSRLSLAQQVECPRRFPKTHSELSSHPRHVSSVFFSRATTTRTRRDSDDRRTPRGWGASGPDVAHLSDGSARDRCSRAQLAEELKYRSVKVRSLDGWAERDSCHCHPEHLLVADFHVVLSHEIQPPVGPDAEHRQACRHVAD